MDSKAVDTIDHSGDPLAFRLRQGSGRSPLFRQRTRRDQGRSPADGGAPEGGGGHRRRGCKHLAADLGRRQASARHRPRTISARLLQRRHAERPLWPHSRHSLRPAVSRSDKSKSASRTTTGSPGSFIHGTGEGHAEAPDIEVHVQSGASTETIKALIAAAMDASPAIAFLRSAAFRQHFCALYQRPATPGSKVSPTLRARMPADPYRVYSSAPRPLDVNARRDLIEKTGQVEQGTPEPASATVTNKLIRNVLGEGKSLGGDGHIRDRHLARHAGNQPFQAGERRERRRRGALRARAALGRHRLLLHDAALALYREHEDEYSWCAVGSVQSLRRWSDARWQSRSTRISFSTARPGRDASAIADHRRAHVLPACRVQDADRTKGSYRPQRKRYSSCGVVTADKTIGNRLLAPAPPLPKC